jgi:hypothetical protein
MRKETNELLDLIAIIHQNSLAKGFTDVTMKKLLVISEISEHVEALRCNRYAKLKHYYDSEKDRNDFLVYIKDSVEDEIADTVIRLLDLIGHYPVYCTSGAKKAGQIRYNKLKLTKKIQKRNVCLELIISELLGMRYWTAYFLLVRYCSIFNIDLDWHTKIKMDYNKERNYKHGKEF